MDRRGKSRARRRTCGIPPLGILILESVLAIHLAAQQPAGLAPPQEGPAQPVLYSHKTHLALGLKCQDCHPNPDPGEHMTFPATTKCMACHTTIAKDRPAIQKLAEFAKSKEAIPWVRVYAIPPGITWSHRAHAKAGLACALCHGDVSKLTVMTKLMSVTTMDGCIGCHLDNHAEASCEMCHPDR